MTIIRPEGGHPVCPRCGLFHDPADHGEGHQHDFPLERYRTCRSIVSIRQNCACGEKAPTLRARIGEPIHWIDRRAIAVGLLGRGETYG